MMRMKTLFRPLLDHHDRGISPLNPSKENPPAGGFSVNEKEHFIYILEFKRVSDAGNEYVTETQQLVEAQHLTVTEGLQKLFKDTQWTVAQLSFVTGHKSVSASICHDLLLKFNIRKEDRVRVIKNLGRTLLDEL
jgi:hypothetical protein